MKLADVTPAYKKKSKNPKDNYRLVSILSNISTNYERCIYDQIQFFFDTLLPKYQCGFRRGYNAQHCLITLIKKWKKSVDNDGAFGALLTDLSKAFDCLFLELLIAKLDTYGFDKSSLKLIHSYLSSSKQNHQILFEWFNNNHMKLNAGNSHLLLSGNSRATAKIDNSQQVLLGVTVDSNLTFQNHINSICRKTSQKLNALTRIVPYMNIEKRRTIMKSFEASQFGYCPFIWMFHSRRLKNKNKSRHEIVLLIRAASR